MEEGRKGGRKGGREGRRGGLENNNLLFANGIFVCALKFGFLFGLLIFRVHVIFSMYMCRYIIVCN